MIGQLRLNCLPVHSYVAKILCATLIADGSGTLLVETPGNQQEVHSSLQTKMVTTLTL